MKKHLLLNQLFGTVDSPNQTGETLTRENRIGLMSYLHRTLMLLFAILVMSVANIGTAWGTEYKLLNHSTKAFTGDFVCNPATPTNDARTISGQDFTCYVKTTGNMTSWAKGAAEAKTIDYDVKTTSTTFTIYVGNTSTDQPQLYYVVYDESSSAHSNPDVAQTTIGEAIPKGNPTAQYTTRSFTVTRSKNARVCIYTSKYSTTQIYQIVANETGSALPVFGEGGYSLNLNKGRFALNSSNVGKIDGNLEIRANAGYNIGNSSNVTIANGKVSSQYFKFTTPASPGKLKLTYSGGQMAYNTSASSAGATNITSGTEYALSASTEYYLINTGAATSTLTNLQFIASSCASYSFHYGTSGQSDWTIECFEYSGAGDVYYVNDFTIPNKPNYYVGNQGVFYNSNLGYGWGENNGPSRSHEDAWSDMPFAASQGDGSGTRPKVGAATGAKGKIRVYDNSTWNNMFVAFEPDGYVLYFNGHEYPFNFVSGNEYRSNLVELNSSSVVGTVAVGVKDGEGNYVRTDNSQEMRHVFFVPSEAWKTSGAKFAIHYWGAGDARTGFLSAVPGKSGWYEGWLPSGATGFQFERQKSDATEPTEGNRWTAGENQTLSAGQNCYTMTATGSENWDGAIEKSLYSAKGVYRIWDNSTAQNWYVNFVPHYVLHYDANDGTGEPADQSVAADASPCQLTVSSTEPTREGYDFLGWNTSSSAASPDGAWDPGDTHAMTGNVTLYAVWECITPEAPTTDKISVSDQCEGTGVTFTANTSGIPSYVTWYWQDAAGGISTEHPATSGITSATTPGTYTKYLRAKNTVCDTWSASGSTPSKSAKVKTAATVSWSAHPTSATYGDGGQTFSVTTNYESGLAWTLENNTCGAALTGSGTSRTLSYTGVGSVTVKVTVTGSGDDYCSSAVVSETITVGAATPTATFNDGEYTVEGSALDLSTLWTSNSSGAVTYTVTDANGTGATIEGSSFTATTAGTASVRASQAANGNYSAITKDATITVNPAADVTAPTLSNSNPANGATGVATSGTIVLTFSEAINSVDGTKFTLTGATKGVVAIDGSDDTKVNVPYSGAANSATLSNISFTTVAAAPAGDCEDEYNSPSTTTYATKTFLDVSTTTYNTSASTNYYLTYSAYWMHNTYKTWTWWNSNDAGSNKEGSAYTYDNAASEGYLATASSADGNNGYGGKKIHLTRRDSIWFTGATSVACLNKGNNSATFTMEVFQVASNGTLSKVGSSYTNATTNVTSLVCSSLNASNYYLVKFYATAASNTYLYQVRFGNACADAPSCSTPAAPTAFAATEETSSSVTLSITDDADAESYDIYYSKSSTIPTSGTAASTNVTSKTPTIDGLESATTYYAWVRSVCDDTHKSDWVALADNPFETDEALSCTELNYVWQTGSSKTPKGVSNTYADGDTATIINSNVATTHITISGTNYEQKKGSKGSLNIDKATDNFFLLTATSGYKIDSVYFWGKLEDGECRMSTDGSTWTGTLGDGSSTGEKVYAISVNSQYFGLKNKNIVSPKGIWIRTMMVKVCPDAITYTVTYNANGHGTAPSPTAGVTPGETISEPSEPSAGCWTFGGWYKDRACTNVWNFAEDEVNSNITLYAKWTSNAARVKSMNYGETNYTVTPAGRADALTVTPVSTTGVTYKWLTNTTDDASSASDVDGAITASYEPSIAEVGTKYYWAVLVHACGNDTTSGIRIHVTAAKTEPTIVWGNVQLNGEDTDPTYGGGGYTLTGTINGGNASTPTLTTDMISADGGIVITNKSVTDAGKTFSLTFDVTAAFDTTQAKLTNIHFSLPSNATYNDSVFSTDLSYEKCSGGSYSTDVYVVGYTNATGTSVSSSPANKALKVAKSWISTASPSFTDKTSTDGFEISATQSGKYWKQSNQTIITTTTGATMRMYRLGTKSLTITWTSSSLSFSKIRVFGMNTSSDPSTLTVSNGTTSTTVTFAGNETGTKEVTMAFTYGSSNGVRFTTTNAKEVDALIELVPTGSDGAGTGTATELQWKSGKAPSDISGWDGTANKLVKAQSDDNFTCVAEQTSATNSVGAITYVSSDVTVATVNATTGEVDIVAGAAGGEATITATMARSGCFKAATLSYTISVSELVCDIDPGMLSASATSKCEDAEVTLTLSDYTSTGTTISWYKSGTAEPLTDGSTYDIDGATMTTAEAGTYYAKVTLTSSGCSLTSNNVTITNKSGAASVSKLVNQWYIKKGRTTPDVALWQLGEGSSYVANSAEADGVALNGQLGGCTVIARDDGIIYLSGADPTGIAAAGNVSLTVQVQDECGHTTTSDAITIHKQVATDKHELAFVTIGTNYSKKEFTEDAWTDGIMAANSTSLALYQLLKDTFKIQATNIYASDDEQKIREYYSQYDLICITDYPNTGTKGAKSKSYVDAIGTLIDIRPVLTMEAYVSGLTNWRAKGVVGTRTTPSARQYNMFLQCKDHEIFEGVRIEQIGYGDDALFKVNMVDSTESRYVELDAVGKDNHATDTAALQGFTTGEMDLLALGYISNGSGGVLQVGAERQEVMKARMMVLGINSYAMERLSDDGLRVVLNALQYLTKKRAEDISDCSSYFIGGAEGHEDEWGWAANWRSGMIPTSNQEARILQPVVVSDTRKIASVKIVANGTFQDEEARGSLTIAPTGALIVEDKIQRSIAPNVMSGSPTLPADIRIETSSAGQGALMLNNDDERTQATVSLYSKGCNNGSYQFQYFASPFNSISSWAFDAYIYNHSETLNPEWTQLRYGEDVEAFQGLALTADGVAKNYEIAGTLASTQPHVYELSYTSTKANNKKGTNVVGNSWSAPIQITRIDDSDFDYPSNFEGIIYIYNAGRDVLVADKVYASNGNSEPGQWQSIPIDLAKTEEWEHKRQIPAFQAFQMKVNAATEFTLDYNKHVRQEASVGDNNYNEPLHAPRKSMRSEAVKVLRLCVEDEQVGKSYIYLCEGDQFTEERDRGWEAQQTIGSGKYGKLYAIDQARDYMMSIARESLEGTPVGFISGLSTEYTITFNETEGTYYLNDLETQQSTLIQEGESYTFTTTKGNHPNRFIISAIPFDKPGIATGVTDLDAEAPKVQKVIYNDKLYIIRGGKVYSAEGQLVK